ncbi:oligosaccharide flippase family protein [Rubrolithibacter danxiaensis]|uniref:oligosaccharide flippase family protein n=1 Tax=Rubrolithibacter danxiaensis TaxID=3390805 RepID=UPI003BF876DD
MFNFQKLQTKLRNIHFLSLAGNGIMSILGMVTLAILYRYLPINEIGIYVFFQSILILFDSFRSGFLTTAFIKFYSGTSKERGSEVVGSTWQLGLAITFGFILLNIIALPILNFVQNAGLALFMKWFGITYLFTLPTFIATCVLQADERFDKLLLIRFVNQTLFIIMVIVLIISGKINLNYVIYANLLASLITSLLALFTGWSKIKCFLNRTNACFLELFHFGKYVVGTAFSANLFRSSDTFIINFMLGPSALAIYNIGLRLMEVVEIPLRSFAATGMPAISKAFNTGNKNEVIVIMRKYIGMLTVALVPMVLITVAFADLAIIIIGGQKYYGTEAANVFRLFMTFALLYPADRFMALTIDVTNRPRINFLKVLVMVVVNVIADFAGIYIFGNVYGIAIASVFPTLIAVIVGYLALQSYSPFSFPAIYTSGYADLRLLISESLKREKTAAA